MISKTHNRRNDTELIPVHMASWQLALKRMFDFVCAFLGIVFLSPLFVIIYIVLLTQRDGHPIFSQERIGMNGKPFKILKFRTMRIDTPKDTPTHLLENPQQWITRVGGFLRKTSLDELPQLLNILKGDMSIVGPRPERPVFVEQFEKETVPDEVK